MYFTKLIEKSEISNLDNSDFEPFKSFFFVSLSDLNQFLSPGSFEVVKAMVNGDDQLGLILNSKDLGIGLKNELIEQVVTTFDCFSLDYPFVGLVDLTGSRRNGKLLHYSSLILPPSIPDSAEVVASIGKSVDSVQTSRDMANLLDYRNYLNPIILKQFITIAVKLFDAPD